MLTQIATSDDGRLLATGHRDGTVTVWDVDQERLLLEKNYPNSRAIGMPQEGFPKSITALAFDSENKLLAIGYAGGVRVIDVKTGDLVTGASGSMFLTKLAFNKTGRLAAAGSRIRNGGPEFYVDQYELQPKQLLAIARARATLSPLNEKDCQEYLGRACEQTAIGKVFWTLFGN
jgi:WD40 repeat protein